MATLKQWLARQWCRVFDHDPVTVYSRVGDGPLIGTFCDNLQRKARLMALRFRLWLARRVTPNGWMVCAHGVYRERSTH